MDQLLCHCQICLENPYGIALTASRVGELQYNCTLKRTLFYFFHLLGGLVIFI